MLDKLKTAIVLLVIGAISGFLIWGANELTYKDIVINAGIREQALYLVVFNKDEDFKLKDELTKNELSGIIVEEVVVEDVEGNILGYIYYLMCIIDSKSNNCTLRLVLTLALI